MVFCAIFSSSVRFGFDLLRDNMANYLEEKVQNGHIYALIDEVDSVLIDDARTPLIISGPTQHDNTAIYYQYKPTVKQLYAIQKQHITELFHQTKAHLADNKKEEAGKTLFTIYRGLPKYPPPL